MTKAAILAVAVLCMSFAGILLAEEYDAASAGTGTEPAPDPKATGNVTKGTVTSSYSGTTLTIKVTADSGYAVPKDKSGYDVEKGATDVTFTVSVANDRSKATITVSSPGGDVKVTATCHKILSVSFEYTKEGKNGGTEAFTKGYASEAYSVKLTSITGYDYPSGVEVTVGTTKLASTAFTYSSGTVNIPAASMTGDVKIKGNYTPKEYKVNSDIDNGSLASSTGKPVYGKDFTFTIEADTNYQLPDVKDLVVNGGSWTYDATTGEVKVSGFSGDITVKALCLPKTIKVVYMDGDKQIDMLVDEFYYGVGGALPDCQKKDHLFKGWFTEKDGHGKQVKSVNPQFLTAKLTVYAYYTDDLSGYDLGSKQMPYYIVAILGIIGFAAVIVLAKVRP